MLENKKIQLVINNKKDYIKNEIIPLWLSYKKEYEEKELSGKKYKNIDETMKKMIIDEKLNKYKKKYKNI